MNYGSKDGFLPRLFRSGINVPLLRLIVGTLGMALPVVVMIWGLFLSGWPPQDSLSDYYSLRTRDAFVGILFVIGWILFAYKGYEKMDNVAGKLACVFAMGVAIFPNSGNGWERIVHFSSAACLFLVLSFFSLFLFTKTKDSSEGFRRTVSGFRLSAARPGSPVTREKKKRNTVYIVCGLVILVCMALVGLYMLLWQNTAISNIKPVFCLEWIMIWAFGFAWFVKGETFWKDKKERSQGEINNPIL
jgi:hypothetical protein